MNQFALEAAAVGAREALKLGAVWLVLSAMLEATGRRGLAKYFYAGVSMAALALFLSFSLPAGIAAREFLARLNGYVFFVFFFLGIVVLYQMQRPAWGALQNYMELPLKAAITMLSAFYFSPDLAGSSMFLRELGAMRDAPHAVYVSAAGGFGLVLYITWLSADRLRRRIVRYFATGQFLMFLALLKFLGGGTRGLSESSLVPDVQRGVMKLVHDFIHQLFVFLMVPDHPMLNTTAWDFIGIFFGPNMGMAISLLILVFLPVMYLYRGLTMDVPGVDEAKTGAERRLLRSGEKRRRARLAAPVALFVAAMLVSWYASRGEQAGALYRPSPKPLIEDKGIVVIPLTDPSMDLFDGNIHKFSVLRDGKDINLLVIRKSDGTLAVTLDACEICPPEGYGQNNENVICVYCMTPIPVDTLGKPGGCNPIPLDASITQSEIRIAVSEIDARWADVHTGKDSEAGGE